MGNAHSFVHSFVHTSIAQHIQHCRYSQRKSFEIKPTMFSKTINTLVVALVAFNAASVIAAPEPVITAAPLEKRDGAIEERQCEYGCPPLPSEDPLHGQRHFRWPFRLRTDTSKAPQPVRPKLIFLPCPQSSVTSPPPSATLPPSAAPSSPT